MFDEGILTAIDFSQIRSTPKSRNDSFESLSIQLFKAHCNAPLNSYFFSLRGDGGDGGVEAYYKTSMGEVLGIQAKYFFKLGSSEFSQIKKSLNTALRNHPTLTQYWIYIPFDLTGRVAEGRRGKSELEKFEEWKSGIEAECQQLKIYLISAELIRQQILEIDSSGGFSLYWFNENILTNQSMSRCIDSAEAFAGPRYCSDLDIITEAHDALDSFGGIYDFEKWDVKSWKPNVIAFRKKADHFEEIFSLHSDNEKRHVKEKLDALLGLISLKSDIHKIAILRNALCMVEEFIPLVEKAVGIQENEFFKKHGEKNDTPSFRQFHAEYMCAFPAANLDFSRELLESLGNIRNLLNSPLIQAFHAGSFLMTGPAGAGKTHSLVSFAKRRLKSGGYTLVLFGEDFEDREPWDVVRSKLGFGADIGRDRLLDCLQASAQVAEIPFIIVIDALNESGKARKWKNKLPEIIQQCKNHDLIKVAVSTRDVYADLVVDERFPGFAYNHIGFTRDFQDVLSSFSKRYEIDSEITPIFSEELRNPLLLHLVFKTNKTEGKSFIDVSVDGFLSIFKKYLSQTDEILRGRLNYVSPKNIVKDSMMKLSEAFAGSANQTVTWDMAVEALKSILGSEVSPEVFINELVNEQLLIVASADDEYFIKIGYQRFGDILRATSLIQSCVVNDSIDISNLADKLTALTEQEQGILEALASVLPEEHGIEITDSRLGLNKDLAHKYFINTLAWRSKNSLTPKIELELHNALEIRGLWQDVFENLFKIFLVPDHYLNAENWFKEFQWQPDQPSRDTYLSIALIDSYENKRAIWSLIDMVNNIKETNWPEASYQLASSALLWCCSATDRRVRDQATRGLSLLFERRPDVCGHAVNVFLGCNDDYILESLILAMYIACLRTDESIDEFVYPLILFMQDNERSNNILIREHALLLKEYLMDNGVDENEFQTNFHTHALPNKWPVLEEIQALLPLDTLPTNMKLWGDNLAPDFWRYVVESKIRIFDLESKDITNENIACWIMKEAVSLGYPGYRESSLNHDRATLSKYGSGRAKPGYAETIGKKCYWIALHRLIGLLSDNISPAKSSWEPQLTPERYWSLSLRKVDVSDTRDLLIDNTYPLDEYLMKDSTFATNDIDAWLSEDDYFPVDDVSILLDGDGKKWVSLHFDATNDTPLDEDNVSFSAPSLNAISSFSGCFVDAGNVDAFNESHHDGNHCYRVYFAEYPDSPTFKQCIVEQHTVISDGVGALSTIQLLRGQEWQYDYSSNIEQESIYMPSPDIVENLNLSWDRNRGWVNQNNELIVFGFSSKDISALFIHKSALDEYLALGKKLVLTRFGRKLYSKGFTEDAKWVDINSKYVYKAEGAFSLLHSDRETQP